MNAGSFQLKVSKAGIILRYRLRTNTIALHQEAGRTVAMVLPPETILKVSDNSANAIGQVEAECNGEIVQVFAIDLRNRAELIKARYA